MTRLNLQPVEIDWSNAPLAKFVNARTRKATARIEALPAPPLATLDEGAVPDVILISVDTGWPTVDLVRRLSANGLRLQLDSAHMWRLLPR